MLRNFGVAIFLYVDDAFWVGTDVRLCGGRTVSEWIGVLFEGVATGLLGWQLDPDNSEIRKSILLLGIQIS
eukprot:6673064-Pyramimonas_sp.AAC.1